MSENSVLRSVEVAVYGRFDTNSVDLRTSQMDSVGNGTVQTHPCDFSCPSSLSFLFPSVDILKRVTQLFRVASKVEIDV